MSDLSIAETQDNVADATPTRMQTQFIFKNKLDRSFHCARCNSYFAGLPQLRQHVMRAKRCGVISDSDVASEMREKFIEISAEIDQIPRSKSNKPRLLKLYQELEKLSRVLKSYDFLDAAQSDAVLLNLFKELSIL